MNEIAETNIPTNVAPNISSDLPAEAASYLPAIAPAAATSTSRAVGWKTTEFWLTATTQLGFILAAVSGALPAKYAAAAVAGSQVAYSLSRGISKVNAIK